MPKTMKALVKKEAREGLWMQDVPVPEIGINDVLIRVDRTGICGTDVHIWKWDAWAQKTIPVPMVVGHEFVGMIEQRVVAEEDVPTGTNLILSASFEKDGEDPPHVATGILSLYHGDKKVGEGRIKTQPGGFMIAGEGLCVGRDSGAAVTGDYPGSSPHRFTGGTIKRVAIDVSGEPYLDLEREAAAMLARE